MHFITATLDFIGGVTILGGRVLRLLFRGRINAGLLVQQMAVLGVNSIPIAVIVLGFVGAVFSWTIAQELDERGGANMIGGIVMLMLLREFIPVFTGITLAGKIGASITSEIGSMRITEQIDALKALSTDPDWYLTLPRMLAGMLMMPVIAVFSGYGSWYAGYYAANMSVDISYRMFESGVSSLVEFSDYLVCFIKCVVFSMVIVLTACYMGYRAEGGAAGVGRAVTNSVVVNLVLLLAFDLLLTVLLL